MHRDVIELLNHDHRMAQRLFHGYEAETCAVQRHRAVDTMVHTLSTHLALEEIVLYPLIRQVVPNGNQAVNDRVIAHQDDKRVLVALNRANRDRSGTDELVAALREQVDHHVRPESRLLDKLRNCVDLHAIDELGRVLEQLKQLVSTQPCPQPPGEPPLLPLTAEIAATYDRLWDACNA